MLLNEKELKAAISRKKPLSKLFDSQGNVFIDDFQVADYVEANLIKSVVNERGEPCKLPPSIFFNDYNFIKEIDINQTLKKANDDFVSEYSKARIFPLSFNVHLFDSFLVVEIIPDSPHTEFLVLKPNGKDPFRESAAMTSLSTVLSTHEITIVSLYLKIDKTLEFLRNGTGKKKVGIFGMFG
jgi:hypothetical protein